MVGYNHYGDTLGARATESVKRKLNTAFRVARIAPIGLDISEDGRLIHIKVAPSRASDEGRSKRKKGASDVTERDRGFEPDRLRIPRVRGNLGLGVGSRLTASCRVFIARHGGPGCRYGPDRRPSEFPNAWRQ
jgi:hypothetical protein